MLENELFHGQNPKQIRSILTSGIRATKDDQAAVCHVMILCIQGLSKITRLNGMIREFQFKRELLSLKGIIVIPLPSLYFDLHFELKLLFQISKESSFMVPQQLTLRHSLQSEPFTKHHSHSPSNGNYFL